MRVGYFEARLTDVDEDVPALDPIGGLHVDAQDRLQSRRRPV